MKRIFSMNLKSSRQVNWLVLLGMCFLAACSLDVFNEESQGQSGSLTRFIVHNGYMYSLNPNEVVTFELQQDGKPVEKHRLVLDYGLETVLIYEGVMYLGSRNGLYIIDISNPAKPVLISETTRPTQLFGGCDPVSVKDSIVFSTVKVIENICGINNAMSALLVYLVNDLSNPELIGTYAMSRPNGLGYKEDVLFVCDDGQNEIVLYDIHDPGDLKELQWAIPVKDPVDLIVYQDRLLVSTDTDFHFYDIQDITDIRPLGIISK